MSGVASRSWSALGRTDADRMVRLLLLVIMFCLPFGAVVFLDGSSAEIANQFTVPRIYLIEPLIMGTALLWAWNKPEVSRHLHPYKPLLGILALAAVSFWWAPSAVLAAITFTHLFVAFLLLYMLTHELRDKHFFIQATWTLVASASVQAAWSIGQFTLGHDFGTQLIGESALDASRRGVAKITAFGETHIRAYGTLPHPNLLAAYIATALFAVGTVVFWPAPKRSWRREAGYAALLVLLGTALLLTFSRSALLLVMVNGGLVVLFSLRRWRRLPIAAAIGAVAFLLAAALLWQPLSGRTVLESSQETGVSNRLVGYEVALQAAQGRPLGVGAGNFVPAIIEFRGDLPDYQRQPAHNAFLLVIAELGWLAGALLIWFLVRTGWLFHRLRPRSRRDNMTNFSLFMLSGTLIGISLVDHFFWSLPQGLWLVAVVLAAVISRIPPKTFHGEPTLPN